MGAATAMETTPLRRDCNTQTTQSRYDDLNILFVLPHNKGILTFSNLSVELIPFESARLERFK